MSMANININLILIGRILVLAGYHKYVIQGRMTLG